MLVATIVAPPVVLSVLLIAAIVLYFLGSGPIQGFAVTLALGILTSLFTAYTVTRFFISIWYRWRRPKVLRIQHFRFIKHQLYWQAAYLIICH